MNFQFSIFKKRKGPPASQARALRAGQTLIELILVMGIAAIILPALLTGFVASRNGKPQQQQRLQAVSVLKETETAVKNIKNSNWNALSTNGTYHTQISGSQWSLAINPFTNSQGIKQEIVIGDVMRDASGAIVEAGGTIDPSTKKLNIIISWTMPYVSSINSTLYLTRTKNQTFTHTTQADFNAGTASNSAVVSSGGSLTDGQVQLAASVGSGGGIGSGGPSSDWCVPNLSITALDLPKSGVANAISAIPGKVFAGTGNNSSGVSFANVTVTNTRPPTSSIDGTADGYKTNSVFGETNYGYLATDNNSKEIIILDLNQNQNGKYVESGYFNAPGNGSGNSIFVLGNIGYMTSGNKLYTFDLSSKAGSRSQLGSLTLDGTGNKIYVVGSYVYVAIGSTTNQLEVVQVSNSGATLTKTASISVAGQAAQDVFVDASGTRAYVATAVSASQKEMFIINVSNKSNLLQVSSYEANGMSPTGITVVTNNKLILVGTSGEEYQVIDISTEGSPSRCGGLNIDTGVQGISSVQEADGDTYSYIVTGDASSELKIIEGGSGGTSVQPNWCSPQNSIVNTFTLPKQGNVLTGQLGKAFIGTGDGSGINFTNLNISSPAPPSNPVSSVNANYSGSYQTNGVYSDGTYAYLAVNGSTSQVVILNTASSTFSQIGTINVPGGTNANGVFVSNNIAYVTSGNKLYAFDVTTKSGSHSTALSQVDMYAESGVTPTAKQVTVVGSKAFVSAAGTTYGLQVFIIGSGGSSLRLAGVSDLDFSQSAQGLSVNSAGTRGYVSFNSGTGSIPKGFFIVDTSVADPPAWWPIPNFYTIAGIYNSGSTDPTGMALASGTTNRALLVGNGGTYQYNVIDISAEGQPLLCGGLAIASGVKGVASIQDSYSRAYSYVMSTEASNQFKIIQGGSGGGNYKEDATFESSIFTVSNSAAFNRLVSTVAKPAKTTIRLQVASALPVSGSCSGAAYSYVGPDGSATSFFTPNGTAVTGQIPFGNYDPSYENPARCFRYKTWFSTWDTSETPILNDVTINYSP